MKRPGRGSPRSRPATARRAPARRPAAERSRELEALYAAARTMASGDDLVATLEQTLELLCAVSRMEFGGVFRYNPQAETLVLVAHRGLSPEDVETLRERPIARSHVGEAVRTGRVIITDLAGSRLLTPRVRARVRAGGYKTQLALPIVVGERAWGAMALISSRPATSSSLLKTAWSTASAET